jgi:hypothetical protein
VRVRGVAAEDLPASWKASWEKKSPTGKNQVQALALIPHQAEKLFALQEAAAKHGTLGVKLTELLRLAMVNTTGCPT